METNSRKSARKSARKPARKSARKPVRKPVRKSRRKSRRKPRRRIKGGGKNSKRLGVLNRSAIDGMSAAQRLGVLSRSAIDGMSAAQQSAFFEYLYTGFVVNRWLQFFCHGESAIRDVLVAERTPTREPAQLLRGFF